MARLMRYDPIELMRKPFELVPRWFEEEAFFPRFGRQVTMFEPHFEMEELDDAYVVRADVPGLDEENLDLELTGTELVISGKRDAEKKEEEGSYLVYERSFGSFRRTIPLPAEVKTDECEASLAKGVLVIRLPKRAEHKSRHIPVQAAEEEQPVIDAGSPGEAQTEATEAQSK